MILPNIGIPELIIILTVALIVFGPGKLPQVGKALGNTIKEFRNSSREIIEDLPQNPKEEKGKA